MKHGRPEFRIRVSVKAAMAADSPARDVADMDITELVKVNVSPFDVSTLLDSGYRASNSVSGEFFLTFSAKF